MLRIFHQFCQFSFLAFLLLFLSSCFDDPSGTKDRAKIADTPRQAPKETPSCTNTQLVSDEGNRCFQGSCPSDYHLVSNQTELDQIIEIYDEEISPTLPADEDTKRRQNFFRARGVCAKGATPARPSNVINIKEDVCVCQNRLSLSTNNCSSLCANRSGDLNATLIINTIPNSTLLNDSRFFTDTIKVGTLNSWCNMTINDGRRNPSCSVQVFNGANTFVLNQNIKFESQNTLSVTVPSGLADDTTYLAKIVESGSGSNAKSVSFQFRLKRSQAAGAPVATPLKIMPMTMYACVARGAVFQGNQLKNYPYAFRQSMFEQLGKTVLPVSNTSSMTIFCHDFQRYGLTDSSGLPRLESYSHIFSLWDKQDNRFTIQGGSLMINSLIHQRLLSEYNLADSTSYFFPFYGGSNGARYHPLNQSSIIQGFVLTAFQDEDNGAAYCPNSSHYNSNEPKFKVLKEMIGTDTEGLFMGVMTPVSYAAPGFESSPQIVTDVIYLRESLLSKIWFYTESVGGTRVNKKPNAETAHTKNLKFYWPPNFNDPLGQGNNYQKSAHQEEYQILTNDEARILIESATTNQNDSGIAEIPTSFRSSDRRLGCVPKN